MSYHIRERLLPLLEVPQIIIVNTIIIILGNAGVHEPSSPRRGRQFKRVIRAMAGRIFSKIGPVSYTAEGKKGKWSYMNVMKCTRVKFPRIKKRAEPWFPERKRGKTSADVGRAQAGAGFPERDGPFPRVGVRKREREEELQRKSVHDYLFVISANGNFGTDRNPTCLSSETQVANTGLEKEIYPPTG